MRSRLFVISVLILACGRAGVAGPPIDLELATEQGVQITAPQEWLQLLAAIGIENVQIRGARPGDTAKVANRGTAERPRFEVFGLLTARDQLLLPGGTFSRADRGRLKDYFARLAADGAESMTAPRGMFGLTEKEIAAVFADLAQPIDFETKGRPPSAVMDQLQAKFALKLAIDADVSRAVSDATPVADELKGVSAGTALAVVLRANGLVMRPEKSRGQPVVYHVAAGGSVAAGATGSKATGEAPVGAAMVEHAGKTNDHEIQQWPIGWEPREAPGQTAPSLFKMLNAQIDGFTLAETLAAMGPRLKVPVYVDHAALAAHKIDPTKVQVRLPKTSTSYKRVIDRAVAHARLHSQVRVDEAGKPFLWITR